MDAQQILREQYKDGSNLNARIALHARFSTNRYGIFRWILDHMTTPADARVLELGTGTAQFWTRNADRIPAGWRVVLSDFSGGILNDGLAQVAPIKRKFRAALIDATALPFPDATFDTVIANHMLYHVPDVPRALREIRRVLVEGGACYAATFSRGNMREFNELVQRFFGVPVSNAAAHFGLENGFDMMRDCFPKVDLLKYPDELIVTESQPLIDWINSTRMRRGTNSDRIAAFKNFLDAEIASKGPLHITKDSGMLVAHN